MNASREGRPSWLLVLLQSAEQALARGPEVQGAPARQGPDQQTDAPEGAGTAPVPGRAPEEAVPILLVGEHAIVRDWLRSRLQTAGYSTVNDVATAEAVEAATTFRPRVVLLDLDSGDEPGSSVCSALREVVPEAAVIVLTFRSDRRAVREALAAGAQGYLLKTGGDLPDIPHVVRRVLAGDKMYDPRATSALAADGGPPPSAKSALSEQELKIVRLVAEGLTNREIAARLRLSRHTVKEYLSNAMRKLGVRTRMQAVVEASRRGLIEILPHPGPGASAEGHGPGAGESG